MRSSRSRQRGSRKASTKADATNQNMEKGAAPSINDDYSRIETLIPYKATTFRPKKTLGKLDLSATPWSISAKLGRFLLSGVDADTENKVARELASYFTEAPIECIKDYEEGTNSLIDYIIKQNPGATCMVEDDNNDGIISKYIITGQKLKSKYCGDHGWLWRNSYSRQGSGIVPVLGFKTATALGAIEILGDDDAHRKLVRTVINETGSKYSWKGLFAGDKSQIRYEFDEAASNRWDDETNREANRKYADPKHTATVFEDKKNCDEKHRAAAKTGFLGHSFKHIEIDDDVDLDVYSKMQNEFQSRWNSGELPPIDPKIHSLRFRKTGRHRAIGVYCDALKGIAVDPRAPKSLLHEFSHAYDYDNSQLSCSNAFRPILKDFRSHFDTEGLSDRQVEYYNTPTEIFARAWEVYAATNGIGGSFVATVDEMKSNQAYKPFFENLGALNEYFSKIAKR